MAAEHRVDGYELASSSGSGLPGSPARRLMPLPTPRSRGRHQSLVRASIRNSRAPIMTRHQCPRINTLVWPGPARESRRRGQEAPPARRLSPLLWQPLSAVRMFLLFLLAASHPRSLSFAHPHCVTSFLGAAVLQSPYLEKRDVQDLFPPTRLTRNTT